MYLVNYYIGMNISEITVRLLNAFNTHGVKYCYYKGSENFTNPTLIVMDYLEHMECKNDKILDLEEKITKIAKKPGHCRSEKELKPKKKRELQQICRDSNMKNWSRLNVGPLRKFIQNYELMELGIYYDSKYNKKRGFRIKTLFNYFHKRGIAENRYNMHRIISIYRDIILYPSRIFLYANPVFHSKLIIWGKEIDNDVKNYSRDDKTYKIFSESYKTLVKLYEKMY